MKRDAKKAAMVSPLGCVLAVGAGAGAGAGAGVGAGAGAGVRAGEAAVLAEKIAYDEDMLRPLNGVKGVWGLVGLLFIFVGVFERIGGNRDLFRWA